MLLYSLTIKRTLAHYEDIEFNKVGCVPLFLDHLFAQVHRVSLFFTITASLTLENP